MSDLIGQMIGRYEVLRQIGSGGMSTVYKASDVDTDRLVAIKLMASFLSKEEKFLTRFGREVELLTQFDHPNIVKVLDFGEYLGSPYIVMPYMSMGTLQDRLRGAPMKATEVAKMMTEMSNALQYAHEKGIVHRDIKPSNMLIDENGNSMLSDFGFARWREASLSLTGSALVGTPSYMSPEQCLGEEVTPLSDQYSLGVVLYRVATGQLPFDGDTPLAIALKQINEALPPPRSVNPKLPIEIANVLEKVLQKNPRDRYPSVAAFNDAFQRALEAVRQTSDRPTTVLPRIGRVKIFFDRLGRQLRWTYRTRIARRWPVILGALILLFGVPLGTAALWGPNGGGVTPDSSVVDAQSTQVMATVNALSTINAELIGAGEQDDPGAVQTAVAGTMEAMAVFAGQTQSAAETLGVPTDTPQPTMTPTPTPTATFFTFFRTATPTPTSGGGSSGPGEPTNTPVHTPTRTPTVGPGTPTPTTAPTSTNTLVPTATNTQVPSNTPVPPTNTPVPPTNTPVPPIATFTQPPVNPPACQYDKPNNPNYCTPEP